MLALLGFFLGLVLVAISIPIKMIQLNTSLRNKRTKLALKKEKIKKNINIKDRLNKQSRGSSKNLENKSKNKLKSATKIGDNKNIDKLKANRGNKKKQKKIEKKLNLKMKMRDLVILQLKALATFLSTTGRALIISGIASALVFMIVVVAFAGACSVAVMVTDGTNHSGVVSTGGGGDNPSSDVPQPTQPTGDALQDMANWYIANVNTYQQSTSGEGTGSRKGYTCDLLGGSTVYDDCTGFSAAYASLVSGKNVTAYGSKDLYNGGQSYIDAGWKRYTISEIGGVSGLVSGDILVCSSEADSKCKGHHAEIFISSNSSFGWGKIQSSYPSSTATFVDSATYSGYIDQGTYHRYGVVYRYVGSSN